MRISDGSSDVCSSDLALDQLAQRRSGRAQLLLADELVERAGTHPHRQWGGRVRVAGERAAAAAWLRARATVNLEESLSHRATLCGARERAADRSGRPHARVAVLTGPERSEEHTSELQSLMRISYAVFC